MEGTRFTVYKYTVKNKNYIYIYSMLECDCLILQDFIFVHGRMRNNHIAHKGKTKGEDNEGQ